MNPDPVPPVFRFDDESVSSQLGFGTPRPATPASVVAACAAGLPLDAGDVDLLADTAVACPLVELPDAAVALVLPRLEERLHAAWADAGTRGVRALVRIVATLRVRQGQGPAVEELARRLWVRLADKSDIDDRLEVARMLVEARREEALLELFHAGGGTLPDASALLMRLGALAQYEQGDYNDAEATYHLLVWGGFEVDSAVAHIARVWFTTGRHGLYRKLRRPAQRGPGYVAVRFLFFEAVLCWIEGRDDSVPLRGLRDLLAVPGCRSLWIVAPMLDALEPLVGPGWSGLMRALGGYIAGGSAEALLAEPRWQALHVEEA